MSLTSVVTKTNVGVYTVMMLYHNGIVIIWFKHATVQVVTNVESRKSNRLSQMLVEEVLNFDM